MKGGVNTLFICGVLSLLFYSGNTLYFGFGIITFALLVSSPRLFLKTFMGVLIISFALFLIYGLSPAAITIFLRLTVILEAGAMVYLYNGTSGITRLLFSFPCSRILTLAGLGMSFLSETSIFKVKPSSAPELIKGFHREYEDFCRRSFDVGFTVEKTRFPLLSVIFSALFISLFNIMWMVFV